MTPHDLIAAFDTVADAPEGIDRLRELVLQLAVRGKLVEQNPNDEPASELLKKIAAEKTRLVREGKARADRRQREGDDAKVPFEVPLGWVWADTAALGFVNPRNEADDDEIVSFAPMPVVPKDFREAIKPETRQWKEIKKGFTHFADGDVAVAKITPCFQNRKSCVMRGLLKGIGAGTTELLVVRPVEGLVDPRYLLAFYKTPDFIEDGVASMTGTAGQQRVSGEYFAFRPVPVPPLGEQHRIVARVDELMGFLDKLETTQNASGATRTAARDAALSALRKAGNAEEVEATWTRLSGRLEDLCRGPGDVEPIRQLVFRLAARGRLSKQDSAEEHADILLSRMRRARQPRLPKTKEGRNVAKKLEALKPLRAEFEVPSGWAYVHLIDAAELVVDCHNKTAPYVPTGVPIVRTTNVRHGSLVFEGIRYVTEATYEFWSRRCPPLPGDLIFTREAPMGEAAIIPEGAKVCLGQRTMLVRPMEEFVTARFLLIALLEPGVREHADAQSVGSTVRHLRVGDVEELPILVPPLAEQRRIVAKVDQMMGLLDRLEAKLREAQETQAAFAAAAVHNLDTSASDPPEKAAGRTKAA